ncbi:MAG: CPBP family intramembrane metalloprotease [Ignavibacteriales bacterium]|nr:CPBP family intramembrane metalloprotease [Ignavibacteriales bacterium]
MKTIFINPELQYMRAGWRIGIFVLIFSACSLVIGGPLVLLAKQFEVLKIAVVPTFATYVALTLATWITLRFVDKRPLYSVGLLFHGGWGKELFQGILLGAGMMTTIVIIFFAGGMITIEFRELEIGSIMLIFLNSAALYTVVGYGEELMFRGYILQVFAEGTNRLIAALTISILFAFAHAKNPNVSIFGLINVGLAGLWLSVAYYKTNALWLAIGLHISWNFFQGFVYSLPVSGTTSDKEQIGKAIVTGPEWLTGGTFGPEGGALATLMLIISIALIYKLDWFKSADGAWMYRNWVADRKQQLAQQSQEQVPVQS